MNAQVCNKSRDRFNRDFFTWLFLFNPSVRMMSCLIFLVFGVKPDWPFSAPLSMIMVIVAAMCKNFGYDVVFFLAWLQNVPGESLGAADVDGIRYGGRYSLGRGYGGSNYCLASTFDCIYSSSGAIYEGVYS